MAYHKASAKQLQFLCNLAELTNTVLPWGWEGYSSAEVAKQIIRLRRQLAKQRAAEEAERQATLF